MAVGGAPFVFEAARAEEAAGLIVHKLLSIANSHACGLFRENSRKAAAS